MGLFDNVRKRKVHGHVSKLLNTNTNPMLDPIMVDGRIAFRRNAETSPFIQQAVKMLPDLRRAEEQSRDSEYFQVPEESEAFPALKDFVQEQGRDITEFLSPDGTSLVPFPGQEEFDAADAELEGTPVPGALMPGQDLLQAAGVRGVEAAAMGQDRIDEVPDGARAIEGVDAPGLIPRGIEGDPIPERRLVEEQAQAATPEQDEAFKSLMELASEDMVEADPAALETEQAPELQADQSDFADMSGFEQMMALGELQPDIQQEALDMDIQDFLNSFGVGL